MTPSAPAAPLDATATASGKRSVTPRDVGLYLVKLAVAGGIVYWLWFSGQLDAALLGRLRWDARGLLALCVSLACIVAGLWTVSLRLNALLAAEDMRVPTRRVFAFTATSSIAGAVLPGVVGADAVRTAYLWSALPNKKPEALAVVLVDRALGLYAMLAAASIGLFFPGSNAAAWAPAQARVICPLLSFFGLLAIAAAGNRALIGSAPARALLRPLPEGLRRLVETAHAVLARPRVFASVLGLALANQFLLVSAYVAFDFVLGSGLPAMAHYALDPVAMVTSVLPITPGGLGVVEAISAQLYAHAGARFGADMALSLRLLQYLVCGTIAAISLVVFRRRQPSR